MASIKIDELLEANKQLKIQVAALEAAGAHLLKVFEDSMEKWRIESIKSELEITKNSEGVIELGYPEGTPNEFIWANERFFEVREKIDKFDKGELTEQELVK